MADNDVSASPSYKHPSANLQYSYPAVPPAPLHLQSSPPQASSSGATPAAARARPRTVSGAGSSMVAESDAGAAAAAGTTTGKRKPKPKRMMDEEQGRVAATSKRGQAVLPFSRMSKIIKADQDINIASKEAVFLISLATEHFIRKLMLNSYTEARLEKRVAVKYQDVAKAVANNDHFFYLSDVVPLTLTAAQARQKLLNRARGEAAETPVDAEPEADRNGVEVDEESVDGGSILEGKAPGTNGLSNGLGLGLGESVTSSAADAEVMQVDDDDDDLPDV